MDKGIFFSAASIQYLYALGSKSDESTQTRRFEANLRNLYTVYQTIKWFVKGLLGEK